MKTTLSFGRTVLKWKCFLYAKIAYIATGFIASYNPVFSVFCFASGIALDIVYLYLRKE